jgi:hypothetical protein
MRFYIIKHHSAIDLQGPTFLANGRWIPPAGFLPRTSPHPGWGSATACPHVP